MRTKLDRLILSALVGLGSSLACEGDQTLDTTTSWDGSSSISAFGNPNTATYGQTFVAPASQLDSYTFYLEDNYSTHLEMRGVVFQWSGSLLGGGGGGAVGAPLYVSPTAQLYNGNGSFQAVTINTGGIGLTPGQDYVMALTVSANPDFADSGGGVTFGDTQYAHVPGDGGGGFVFYNNGNNFGLLNTTTWDNFADFGDLAFKAQFVGVAVPEPTTIVSGFVTLGLVLMPLVARFRRSGVAATEN